MSKRRETRPDPYDIGVQFLVEKYTQDPESEISRELYLRYWRQEWYVYAVGSYRRIALDELRAEIAGFLHDHQMHVSTPYVGAVILALTHLCMVDSRHELDSWLNGVNGARIIAAANGNISLSDRGKDGKPRLLPHTANYFTLSRLPYAYAPEAACRLWLVFLDAVMQGRPDYIALLQQWAGYLFRPDLREQKFLLCVGDGANGKGVVFDVFEALVGSGNTSHVPLARFENPFALYSTIGKRLNVTNEAIGLIEEFAESQLKTFVAGDAMSFERKFLNPVDAKPTAKLMVATNALPRFNDKTYGTWRRILLVPFNVTIEEKQQVKTLAAELKTELPGILNWALDGLKMLDAAGGFTIPQAHAEMLEEYRRDADPARAFLMENYQPSPNGEYVPAKELYAAYVAWTRESGCQAMNERHFGRHVRRIFPNAERRNHGTRDSRAWVYTGLCSIGVPCVP